MPDTIPPSHFLTEMSLGRGCGRVFLKHCLQEQIMTSHCGKRPTIFLNMKSSLATMKRLINHVPEHPLQVGCFPLYRTDRSETTRTNRLEPKVRPN